MNNNQSLKGITPEATIDQIITAEDGVRSLLASIGLSPENHKTETLRSVCQQKKWSEVEVLKWLKKNQNRDGQNRSLNHELPGLGNSLHKWCGYLEKQFLTKSTAIIDDINRDFPRVHKIHGNQYGWLKNMQWYLEKLEEKLNYYFYFQSHKLFPLLRGLEDSKQKALHGTIKQIENGIEIIREDHDEILELIETVEEKGQGLRNPEGACSTLRILNYNVKTLCSLLRNQIEIEQQHLIPLVKQKLKSG